MKALRNQLGMTLIEVMIVAFVSLIMVGGLSYVVSEVFKSQAKMMESYETQSITNIVTLAMRDEATCTGNFQNVVLPTLAPGQTQSSSSSDVDVTARFLAMQTTPPDGGIGGPGGGPSAMASPFQESLETAVWIFQKLGDGSGGGPATTTTTTLVVIGGNEGGKTTTTALAPTTTYSAPTTTYYAEVTTTTQPAPTTTQVSPSTTLADTRGGGGQTTTTMYGGGRTTTTVYGGQVTTTTTLSGSTAGQTPVPGSGAYRFKRVGEDLVKIDTVPLFNGGTTLGGTTRLTSAKITDITKLTDDTYRASFVVVARDASQNTKEVKWPHIRMRVDAAGKVVSCSLADRTPASVVSVALQWPSPAQQTEPTSAGSTTPLALRILMSTAQTYDVQVNFTVDPGNNGAVLGQDYEFPSNACAGSTCSAVITAGSTDVTVPINVLYDVTTEGTESFRVALDSAVAQSDAIVVTQLSVAADPVYFAISEVPSTPPSEAPDLRCALGTPSSHGPWRTASLAESIDIYSNLDTVCEVIVANRTPTATYGVNNFQGYNAPGGEYPFKVEVQSDDGGPGDQGGCWDPGSPLPQCTNGTLSDLFAMNSGLWSYLLGAPGFGYQGSGRYIFTIPANSTWYDNWHANASVITTDMLVCKLTNGPGRCRYLKVYSRQGSPGGSPTTTTSTTLEEPGVQCPAGGNSAYLLPAGAYDSCFAIWGDAHAPGQPAWQGVNGVCIESEPNPSALPSPPDPLSTGKCYTYTGNGSP